MDQETLTFRTNALLMATILALAGCGGTDETQDSGASSNSEPVNGSYSIDAQTGDTIATIETEDGPATLRSGTQVPIDLPAGFSIFPDAEILTNTVFDRGDAGGARITMRTDASPDLVIDHYRAEAEAAGIDIGIDARLNGSRLLGGQGPDGLTFSIDVEPGEDDATLASLTVDRASD